MPYTPEHKHETRQRIVRCAHQLFNRHGFNDVSIDDIMARAGLTRGGFYNHFKAKEDLYAETMRAYAVRRQNDNAQMPACGADAARGLIERYVSRQHRDDLDDQCPLMALPSDVAHAGPAARAAYQQVLESMIDFFESNLEPSDDLSARQRSMALAATCVGAMVLARTIEDDSMADDICKAAVAFAHASIAPEAIS